MPDFTNNSLLKILKINFFVLLCAVGLSSLMVFGAPKTSGEDYPSIGYLVLMCLANGAVVFVNVLLAIIAFFKGDRRRAGIYFLGSIIVFLIGLGLCFGPMFVLNNK